MTSFRLKHITTVAVFFFSLLGGFISIPAAMAEIQYVSDLLIISLKESQDPDAPVIGYLRSAAALEILDETEEMMLVRTEDGKQGWVRKKFIVKDKPKALIIGELEEKIAGLESDINTLQQGSPEEGFQKVTDGYKQEIASLKTALEDESKNRLALENELKQINDAHQQLLNKSRSNQGIDKELASLKNENKVLKDKMAVQSPAGAPPVLSRNMKWFLIGGGVLLLGFIIGRSIRKQRTYRY